MTTEVIHSSRSASGSSRWMKCLGQPAFVDQLVADGAIPKHSPSSIHAQRGTAAHDVLSLAIQGGWEAYEAWDILQKRNLGFQQPEGPSYLFELDDEDFDAIELCCEFVEERRKSNSTKQILHSEVKFEIAKLHPLLFGTADIVLVSSDLKHLTVIDYKHGAGVPVEVDYNPQLLYYALGAIEWVCNKEKLDYVSVLGWGGVFESVEIVVVQPRCAHKDGPIRSFTPSAEEIDLFADRLKEACEATLEPNAPLSAGDHCRWCPASALCPEISRKASEVAMTDFAGVSDVANLALKPTADITVQQIAKLMRFEPVVSDWFKQVAAHALDLAKQGIEIPGMKLVEKRVHRKWADPEEAATFLCTWLSAKDMYKLNTPAQIQKALGKEKNRVNFLIHQPTPGVTLAPEYDKRKAVTYDPTIDFKD